MTDSYERRYVWDFFTAAGLTKEGTAGLMGNLYAESGVGSKVLERLCRKRYSEQGIIYTDSTYTNAVDDGSISKSEFISPMGKHYGYGLAQWTATGRKTGLYEYIKSKGVSIGDLQAQCEYLLYELQTSFKNVYQVLTGTNDINAASDAVLLKFEAPANAESYKELRRGYSEEFYKLYGGAKMVIIGSARIDENGNASGGKAGDQTGNEVSIQEYYTHKKGWRVIRAKDAAVREAIAQNMEWACANDYIGYNQGQNQTLYNVVAPLGFNCSLVTTPCEADCARLMRVCVLYAGIKVKDFYTATEADALLATGAFEEVSVSLPYGLLRGDILVTKTKGHTVVALTNGDGTTGKETGNTNDTSTNTEPAAGKYTVGWHKDDKGWWYADTANTYLKKTWKVINHHWYYFDEKGYMLKGWQTIDGKKYYLQESEDNNLQGACWKSDGSGVQSVWYVE
ncbi:hypothetical protein BXO88_02750 [Oribacterium sp. C9]|uniref:phage tail tip lysozyme n=1 Tax=Oribacterium sp. C9 TaxID=1943579 RepID=UPI00098FAFA8|nr:phage tail tip lysozyme [Oribacterium sp. C9]OON87613.1 hypothetical protein BXO88_02750 [Oribacterium sp. C9]